MRPRCQPTARGGWDHEETRHNQGFLNPRSGRRERRTDPTTSGYSRRWHHDATPAVGLNRPWSVWPPTAGSDVIWLRNPFGGTDGVIRGSVLTASSRTANRPRAP